MWPRALVLAGVLPFSAGCSADVDASPSTTIDYRKAGETAIERAMAEQFGVGVEAQCDQPPSTEPAATFDCVGTLTGGSTVEFVATITESNGVTIALGEIP